MKPAINIKRITFYAWVALAFLLIWLFIDLVNYPETFFPRALNEIWRLLYVTVLNFILFEYALPYIKLTWKRMLIGLLLIWALLMLYSFGLQAWRLIGVRLHIHTITRTFASEESKVSFHFAYSAMSILFFGIISHIYNYTKLKRSAQQLRIEKQQAELSFLKAQTNPHFLFNTLNNIYSLARDKSDLAPESILRLSKILRFMLYETSGSHISIEQELKVIGDYIALEKLRYDDSLSIQLSHDIDDIKEVLPPLLLMPLVENAFKHGVSETREQPFIDIYLTVKKQQLTFLVKNSTDKFSEEVSGVKENIGLSNLRRQLELLYTDYQLSIQQGKTVFIATLNINLTSHV